MKPIYTIGHSNRTMEAFADLLGIADIALVVDIRTVPRSRANPQYNADSLPVALAAFGIGYERIAELGGLRKRVREIPPELNGYWENRSFHNYADYALTEGFRRGLDRLLALAEEKRTAIMCAEAVWWRCHRRIVADHLIVEGKAVYHLMDPARAEPARLTPGAVARKRRIVYPAPDPGSGSEG